MILSNADSARYGSVGRVLADPEKRRLLRAHGPDFVRGVVRGHPGSRIQPRVRLGGPGEYNLARSSCIRSDARLYVGPEGALSLAKGSSIGERTVINVESSVRIGTGVQISWQCQILDTDFHVFEDDRGRDSPRWAPIVIEDSVLIGTGAIILKGVTIGKGSVIAAEAVVSRSVGAHRVAAGNPAKEVKRVAR